MRSNQIKAFPMDEQRWRAGLTLDQYVRTMHHKQDAMRRRLQEVTLQPLERNFFSNLEGKIRVLVMTEDWCGDSLMNLPILAKIVRATPRMEMRIFIRSQFAELEGYFASREIHSIPVFAFLDHHYNMIGTWIERPQAAQILDQQWYADHPEIEAINASAAFTAEQKKSLLRPIYRKKLSAMEDWYNQSLQQATVDEIKSILCPEPCYA